MKHPTRAFKTVSMAEPRPGYRWAKSLWEMRQERGSSGGVFYEPPLPSMLHQLCGILLMPWRENGWEALGQTIHSLKEWLNYGCPTQ